MIHLIDNAKDWWRMTSNQINLVWGAICAVWMVTPREDQINVLNSFGLDGTAVAPAIQFFVQVAAAVATAAIAARVTAQPALQARMLERQSHQPPQE